MAIDKSKVVPASIENNEVTAMNVTGKEENSKYVIDVVEIDGRKQYGEKDIMSSELVIGTEIKAVSGGKGSKSGESR